ncbi:MAG: hypothetical protein HY722_05260, partial [Planctomycetes bacterium]|nr:hypothetical protein [Planctomycetota bacterium]
DTVEGLAEAFVGLARDREAARRMGGAGLATARARFGLETQAEAVEALYREVLGG